MSVTYQKITTVEPGTPLSLDFRTGAEHSRFPQGYAPHGEIANRSNYQVTVTVADGQGGANEFPLDPWAIYYWPKDGWQDPGVVTIKIVATSAAPVTIECW